MPKVFRKKSMTGFKGPKLGEIVSQHRSKQPRQYRRNAAMAEITTPKTVVDEPASRDAPAWSLSA